MRPVREHQVVLARLKNIEREPAVVKANRGGEAFEVELDDGNLAAIRADDLAPPVPTYDPMNSRRYDLDHLGE